MPYHKTASYTIVLTVVTAFWFRMDEELRPISEAMPTVQPSKRVKRTELLMDVTLLVEKKILQASTEINESNVVSKGYRDTINKTTTQLMKDEKELADWTQLLADLEIEVEKPGTGSTETGRVEAMKKIIADNAGSVSDYKLFPINFNTLCSALSRIELKDIVSNYFKATLNFKFSKVLGPSILTSSFTLLV